MPKQTSNLDESATLRSDVRRLGDLLGQSLVRHDGQKLLDLVESVRKSVREGKGDEILKSLSNDEKVKLVRAFNVYFNLANVAEQVHRSRILAISRNQVGSWLTRAVNKVEQNVDANKVSTNEIKKWLENFEVRPVFTAHPTEAARRSILTKLATISDLLDQPENTSRDRRLAEAVDLLWQTDELRLGKPEPLDEAINALYY
ncbi:MAG: hypothetical protein RLY74_990, partial [Actinomycetota bacterium]